MKPKKKEKSGEKSATIHCKSACLYSSWWALKDSHRIYAAIYQRPELVRENCAYISLFFSVSSFQLTMRKSNGNPSHILCYILSILACEMHADQLCSFQTGTCPRQLGNWRHPPHEWFIPNDSPNWGSYNLEEEGGQQSTQTWLCSVLQPGLE